MKGKKGKAQPKPTTLRDEPYAGASPATPANEEARPEKSDYMRGYAHGRIDGHEDAVRQRRSQAERAIAQEAEANERLIVEFGDSTVVIRDGLGAMVSRIPLVNGWSQTVGRMAAARGAKLFSPTFAEHALFTIREQVKEEEARIEARAGGSGMDFKNRGSIGAAKEHLRETQSMKSIGDLLNR